MHDDARQLHFGAGPAAMPVEVLDQLRAEIACVPGAGTGLLEIPHRGAAFDVILDEARDAVRAAAAVPPSHDVVFLHGGATTAFALVAMALTRPTRPMTYLDTGVWTSKAIDQARAIGPTDVAWSGRDLGYVRLPRADEWHCGPDAAFLHYCANNTIHGTRWSVPPATPDSTVPLVADVTSDLLTRPIDVGAHGIVLAGIQKTLGPAGLAVAFIDRDLLATVPASLPPILSIAEIARAGSRLNTPNVFAIRACGLMARWTTAHGGPAAFDARRRSWAGRIVRAIEEADAFYRFHAAPEDRSDVNIVFHSRDAETDARFVSEAADAGIIGVKGHRAVGGLRVSLYNACTDDAVDRVAAFIASFARGG